MPSRPRLDPAILRQLLDYDSATGRLVWRQRDRKFFRSDGECKRWNGRYAGKDALTLGVDGYLDGYILRTMHRAHIVAWVLHHGRYPTGQIDHINGNRADNRIANLREVDARANARNTKLRTTNKSGTIGVSPFRGKWRATIMNNDGRQIHLGVFATVEQAKEARLKAEAEFGYDPTHGRAA